MTSEKMCDFFGKWGVGGRVASAHFLESNGRAETAVKSAKRLLRENTGTGGSHDTDRATVALLQYLNMPLRGGYKSQAQLAMGRELQDGIPVHKQHYKVNSHWKTTFQAREREVVRQQDAWVERQGTPRNFTPIKFDTQVWLQDQASKLWDRCGVVTEVPPHSQ